MFRMRSLAVRAFFLVAFCCPLLLFTAGCQSTGAKRITAENLIPPILVLVPGDVLDIKFPGAATLSGQFKIGPEGFLSLPLVGQVSTAGLTAHELQEHLVKLYETQLQDNEVIVTLAASANVIYVTGSVLNPGPIPMDRPLTALEAIMNAGGFNLDQANMEKVTVVRYEGEQNFVYHLDLEPILSGGPVPPFYLQPRDIVHVPQKVQWF